jgi:hypothetical membrane protein
MRDFRQLLFAPAAFFGAGALYLAGETLAARAWAAPAYDYARNWVSDLGAPVVGAFHGRTVNSPLHAVMNAAFVADGLLFLLGAMLLAAAVGRARSRAFLAFAAAHSLGMLLVGLVPETTAAPAGSLHLLGALLAIAGGNIAIILGSTAAAPLVPRHFQAAALVLGTLGLASFVLLNVLAGLFPDLLAAAGAGLVERLSVYPITAWELLASLWLPLARRRGA